MPWSQKHDETGGFSSSLLGRGSLLSHVVWTLQCNLDVYSPCGILHEPPVLLWPGGCPHVLCWQSVFQSSLFHSILLDPLVLSLVYRLHSPGSTECSATTRGKRRSIIISSMLDAWRIDESILSACDSDFSLDINWDGCLFIVSKRVHVSVFLFDFRCHAVLSLWTVQYKYEAQKTSSNVFMLVFLPALLQ